MKFRIPNILTTLLLVLSLTPISTFASTQDIEPNGSVYFVRVRDLTGDQSGLRSYDVCALANPEQCIKHLGALFLNKESELNQCVQNRQLDRTILAGIAGTIFGVMSGAVGGAVIGAVVGGVIGGTVGTAIGGPPGGITGTIAGAEMLAIPVMIAGATVSGVLLCKYMVDEAQAEKLDTAIALAPGTSFQSLMSLEELSELVQGCIGNVNGV